MLAPRQVTAETHESSALLRDEGRRDLHGEQAAVLPPVTGLEHLRAVGDDPLDAFRSAAGLLIGVDVAEAHADQLISTVAGKGAVRLVDVGDQSLPVNHPEPVSRRLEDGVEVPLPFPQGLLVSRGRIDPGGLGHVGVPRWARCWFPAARGVAVPVLVDGPPQPSERGVGCPG
jgi:hypothetical protein